MIYAIARLNNLGMLSIYIEKQSDTRRKRLRCASDTINLQPSIQAYPGWIIYVNHTICCVFSKYGLLHIDKLMFRGVRLSRRAALAVC